MMGMCGSVTVCVLCIVVMYCGICMNYVLCASVDVKIICVTIPSRNEPIMSETIPKSM